MFVAASVSPIGEKDVESESPPENVDKLRVTLDESLRRHNVDDRI